MRVLVVLVLVTAGLMVAPVASATSNDDRAQAAAMTQLPFSDVISTVGATTEPGESSCVPIGATVWYSLTPATDVLVEISTAGSDFDTALTVYDGSSVVGCNDDDDGTASRIRFAATGGQTYLLQAGGYEGASGVLHLAANMTEDGIPNDDLENATVVDSLPFTARQSTLGWSLQAREPLPCSAGGGSVWFRYSPDQTTPVGIGTFSDTWQDDPWTVVAVYSGTSLTDLQPVACNADSGTRAATVTGFLASGGSTYWIQVSGATEGFPDLRVRISTGMGAGTNFPANAGVVADTEEVQAGAISASSVMFAGADAASDADHKEITAVTANGAGLVVGRVITADGDVDVLVVAATFLDVVVVTAGTEQGAPSACLSTTEQEACV